MSSAERIQHRMHDLRGQLDNDLEEVVDSAKEFTDWRTYSTRRNDLKSSHSGASALISCWGGN